MASKNNFFNRGLSLLANYQFNNNLIDDARGYNLTGQNITYNNGNVVFSGISSKASRTDTNNIFSFTDGTNDLPFRIEIEVTFDETSTGVSGQWIVSKRDDAFEKTEWQLLYNEDVSSFQINLYSVGDNQDRFIVRCYTEIQDFQTYKLIIDYDGSKTLDGLNISVDGNPATSKLETGNYVGMSLTGSDLLLGQLNFNPSFGFYGKMNYLKIYK